MHVVSILLNSLKKKLEEVTAKHGVKVTDTMRSDFGKLIDNYNPEIKKLPQDDFKRVFWEQQVWSSKFECLGMLYYCVGICNACKG